jgi:hypothetical protein
MHRIANGRLAVPMGSVIVGFGGRPPVKAVHKAAGVVPVVLVS